MQSIPFDRAASYYDATRGYTAGSAERIRDAIIAATAATPATTFLEIGVGTGRIALPFLAAGHRYVGVDLSRPMLQVLGAKLPAGAPLPLVEADITRLPVADGRVDVVIGVHILHLVGNWRAALREVRRALKPQGAQLLLAYDSGIDLYELPPDAPPPVRAQHAWVSILDDLGYSAREGQPGIRPQDPAVRALLEELGGAVQERDLGEYERPAISARAVVDAYRNRIYSSDWSRPEAVHNAALGRLEEWLAAECPAPDMPHRITGRFRAILARWS